MVCVIADKKITERFTCTAELTKAVSVFGIFDSQIEEFKHAEDRRLHPHIVAFLLRAACARHLAADMGKL
jgi:hypothetical protein